LRKLWLVTKISVPVLLVLTLINIRREARVVTDYLEGRSQVARRRFTLEYCPMERVQNIVWSCAREITAVFDVGPSRSW